MQPFTRALFSTITGNAPIMAAFTGGFALDRMPTTANYPYLVASVVANPQTTAYRGAEFYEPTIRFTAFGVGQDALLGAMQTLIAQLDQLLFTGTGLTLINTTRKTDILPTLTKDVDGNGKEVARCDVIYDFAAQSF
jgi:hypothetical protein